MMNRREFIKSVAVASIAPSIIGNVAEPKPQVLDLSPWLVTIHSWGIPIIQPFIMRPNPIPTPEQIYMDTHYKCVMRSPLHSPWWIEHSEDLPTVQGLFERAEKIDYKSQNLGEWKQLPSFMVTIGHEHHQCFRATCWAPPKDIPFCECVVAAKPTDQGYLWTLLPVGLFA